MAAPSLSDRVDALEQAATLARGRLADTDVDRAVEVAAKVRARLGHGTEHTLVALVGPTGAGKSTIFNHLARRELSQTGVRRPTTSQVHSCSWAAPPDALLDWLDVSFRHHIDPESDPTLAGLVLLDLPDFDSTATAHKVTVDRLIELVDMLVWVVDPQKYADASFHDGYVVPFAGHGSIMRFVFSKTDTVAAPELPTVIEDFERRLREDGIEDPTVISSADSEEGQGAVRAMLEMAVADKQASLDRLEVDLVGAASHLSSPDESIDFSRRDRSRLIERLADAAGSDQIGHVASQQHRHDGRRAMASPPVRWFARRSRKPVAELPRVASSPVHSVAITAALRDAAEDAAGGNISTTWGTVLRRTLEQGKNDVIRRITESSSTVVRTARPPRWWSLVAWIQRLLAGVAAAGFVWLLAAAVAGGFLALDTDPLLIDTPGADWIPVPSLMVLAGVGAALLIGVLVGLPLAAGARRRSRRARHALTEAIRTIVDEHIVTAMDGVHADRAEISRLLEVVRPEGAHAASRAPFVGTREA